MVGGKMAGGDLRPFLSSSEPELELLLQDDGLDLEEKDCRGTHGDARTVIYTDTFYVMLVTGCVTLREHLSFSWTSAGNNGNFRQLSTRLRLAIESLPETLNPKHRSPNVNQTLFE